MAMYLPRYNFLFIHIYKTGGMALRTALQQLDKRYFEIGRSHADYQELSELTDMSDKVVFSVVRDPYDWVQSLYHFCKRDRNHPMYLYVMTHGLNDFVKWMIKNMDLLNTCSMNGKIQSQTEYLSMGGEVKAHILKMETLENDFNNLLNSFGYRERISISEVNKGRYDNWNLSVESIDLINERFKQDFINFNY